MILGPEILPSAISVTLALIFLVLLTIFFILPPKLKKGVLAGILFLVALAILGLTSLSSTPEACKLCHEMKPYYSSWSRSPHAEVSCPLCHRKVSLNQRLKNLALHFTRINPRPKARLTSDVCTSCHEKEELFCPHTERKDCNSCHPQAGHPLAQ